MATPVIRIIPCTDRALVLGYEDHPLDRDDFKGLPEPYPEFEPDVIGVGGDWTSYQHVLLRRGTTSGAVEYYDSSTNGTAITEQNVTVSRTWSALPRNPTLLLSGEVFVRVEVVEGHWIVGFVPMDASGKMLLDTAVDIASRIARTLLTRCGITGISAAENVEPRHRLIGRLPLTNTWLYQTADEPRKATADERARTGTPKKRPSDKREPRSGASDMRGSKQRLREVLFNEALMLLDSVPNHQPSALVLRDLCEYSVPDKRLGVIADTIKGAKDKARLLHSMSMCRGQLEERARRLDCSGCPGWFVDRFAPKDNAIPWFDARSGSLRSITHSPGVNRSSRWLARLEEEVGMPKGEELALVLRRTWSDKDADVASRELACEEGPAHKRVLQIAEEVRRRGIKVPNRVLSRVLCPDPKAQARIDMWLRRAMKKTAAA